MMREYLCLVMFRHELSVKSRSPLLSRVLGLQSESPGWRVGFLKRFFDELAVNERLVQAIRFGGL